MGIKIKMFWLRKLRITVLLTIRVAIAHEHGEIHSNVFWVFSEMAAHFQTLPIIPDGNHAKNPTLGIYISQIPVGCPPPPWA